MAEKKKTELMQVLSRKDIQPPAPTKQTVLVNWLMGISLVLLAMNLVVFLARGGSEDSQEMVTTTDWYKSLKIGIEQQQRQSRQLLTDFEKLAKETPDSKVLSQQATNSIQKQTNLINTGVDEINARLVKLRKAIDRLSQAAAEIDKQLKEAQSSMPTQPTKAEETKAEETKKEETKKEETKKEETKKEETKKEETKAEETKKEKEETRRGNVYYLESVPSKHPLNQYFTRGITICTESLSVTVEVIAFLSSKTLGEHKKREFEDDVRVAVAADWSTIKSNVLLVAELGLSIVGPVEGHTMKTMTQPIPRKGISLTGVVSKSQVNRFIPGKAKTIHDLVRRFGMPDHREHWDTAMTRCFSLQGETYWWGLTGVAVDTTGSITHLFIRS